MTQNGLTPELRLPKQAIGAERAVIGACFVGRQYAQRARQVLAPADFYSEKNRLIFAQVIKLLDQGSEIDLFVVSEHLRQADELVDAGGAEYLSECSSSLQTAETVDAQANLVRWCSLSREIQKRATLLSQDPEQEKAVQEMTDLVLTRRGLTVAGWMDFQTDLVEEFDNDQGDREMGIHTILTDVVIYKGDVFAVVARPGDGKTALSTAIMLAIAKKGESCGYVTTEMSKVEMLYRVLPMAAGIEANKFYQKRLTPAEVKKVGVVIRDNLSKLPIKIWSHPSPRIEDIQAFALRSKCRVLFVDYLQRCSMPSLRNNDPRTYQIEEFMKRLKTFCSETGLRCILACQAKRDRDKEKGPPVLSDLADSGAVEKESVSVGFLWRPGKDEGGPDRELEWITRKHRKGDIDVPIKLKLRKEYVEMCSAYEARPASKPAPDLPSKDEGEAWWDK